MRKGSTQYPDVMRQPGGGSVVISHKRSKKVKTLSSVGGLDKGTCSKRVKLPKKLLDYGHPVNLLTVPRKSRSVPSVAMHKRRCDPSAPNLTNAMIRCEMPSTDGKKKIKLDLEDQHLIMKNEEDAIAGLLALAGNDSTDDIKLNDKTSEATSSNAENLVPKYAQIHDLNESRNILDLKKDCKEFTAGNESRKRCASHVYICQVIKNLKNAKGKMVISQKEAKSVIVAETAMNVSAGINLNEAIPSSENTFEGQPSGCGIPSYFGNPYCDPSQWSRPMFPNQQMWMNPFMYKQLQSGPYVQASLHNVQLSKHHPNSGYDANGAMFRVDIPTTLKLALL